ncbi:hypothetical protein ACQ86D_27595 [Streptomyces galilaeus]
MDNITLWVLAVFGFIGLVCVMGTQLASTVEQFISAWINAIQRLNDLLRRRTPQSDDEDVNSDPS